MGKQLRICIDSDNMYLTFAIQKLISGWSHIPVKYLDPQDTDYTPSILFQHECRKPTPKSLSYEGQHVTVVIIRQGSARQKSVLRPCTHSNLCIFRDDPVEQIRVTIKEALDLQTRQLYPATHRSCFRCRPIYLTESEQQFLRLFLRGNTPTRIGFLIHKSVKTVSSHKRSIMKKLQLNSDWELFNFFNQIR